jgi:hypothetical protein
VGRAPWNRAVRATADTGRRSHRCPPSPLFREVDSLQLPVPSLDAGLTFYRDALGHRLLWRSQHAAGLGMPDSDTEIVVQIEHPRPEVDLLVASAELAAERVVAAGGALAKPRGIPCGRVVMIADPFGTVWCWTCPRAATQTGHSGRGDRGER